MRWYRLAFVDNPPPLQTLPQILAPIADMDYAVLGGAAMAQQGYLRRYGDVDILMRESDMEEAVSRFGGGQRITSGWKVTSGDHEIDIISLRAMYPNEVTQELEDEALFQAKKSPFKMLSKPFLLLSKFISTRDSDVEDLQMMLKQLPKGSPEYKQVVDLIRRNMPDKIDDMKSMRDLSRILPKDWQPKDKWDKPVQEPKTAKVVVRVALT
jgi:hypothetical protein